MRTSKVWNNVSVFAFYSKFSRELPYIFNRIVQELYTKRIKSKLLTIVARVLSVISRPQMNHLTLVAIGDTRAQNDTTEPCIATTETGSSMNAGISGATSAAFFIRISHEVEQHPYSDATMHVKLPESITAGFIIRNAINPSP